MTIKSMFMATAALATLAFAGTAANAGRVIAGSTNGLSWQAQSTLVGVGSTATIAAGGNPIYTAPKPQFNGVVSLIMDYGGGSRFICSGTLVSTRHIVTAGHCVSDGAGTAGPLTTTAYFYGGPNPDTILHAAGSGATAVNVSSIAVNPLYTGNVIDQNDLAVLTLSEAAPAFATMYGLDFSGNMQNAEFNVAGYGGRSTVGGNLGVDAGTGRLRQGLNNYDFRFGDADFGGFWDGFFGDGTADTTHSWISDFDNGLAANDSSCILAGFFGLGGAKYCHEGVGLREVGLAGGDSGGPGFINGRLASVNSFGLSFGTDFGDIDDNLNSTFGEFSGYAPLYSSRDFILTSMGVPEPATWLMMIMGFGMIGATMRQRRSVTFRPAVTA